jgi:hypothetical protein
VIFFTNPRKQRKQKKWKKRVDVSSNPYGRLFFRTSMRPFKNWFNSILRFFAFFCLLCL